MLEQCALGQKIKEAKPDAQQMSSPLWCMNFEPGADSAAECQWIIGLAGPFPADKHGSTYICVAVDSFSLGRFVMAFEGAMVS